LYRYDAAGAFSISDPLMSIGLYRQKGTQQLQANGVITGSLKYSSDDGGKIPGALEIFGVGKISTEEREAVLAVLLHVRQRRRHGQGGALHVESS
jgi:hypothetical protein